MKRSLIVAMAAILLLIPIAVYAQSGEKPSQAPSVAQSLIREGDFAMKLVDKLKLGTAQNEAEAESTLASSGIAPRNGWIADYPVTPDIIGELATAIADAAESGRLTMGREEATKAFQNLTTEVGLPVMADTKDESSSDVQASNYAEYADPDVVNNYYHNEGPPVVTYYPPPWDYYYMYAWVPSPFWCSGFFFPGFFILHDFHRVIIVHKRPIIITNHYRDPRTKRIGTIDPVERLHGRNFREVERGHPRGYDSTAAKNGASSIYERNRQRVSKGLADRSPNSSGPQSRVQRKTPDNREGRSTTFNTRRGDQPRPPAVDRRMSGAPAQNNPRDTGGRAFSQPGGVERPSEVRPSNPPSQSETRSFSSPPMAGRGSFQGPQMGGHGGFSMGR